MRCTQWETPGTANLDVLLALKDLDVSDAQDVQHRLGIDVVDDGVLAQQLERVEAIHAVDLVDHLTRIDGIHLGLAVVNKAQEGLHCCR